MGMNTANKLLIGLLVAAIATATSPVQAAGFAGGDYGGWTVAKIDEACGMTMEYEGAGSTRLSIFERYDGRRFAIVDNDLWSAKEGEAFAIKAELGEWVYTLPAEGSTPTGGRRGLLFLVSDDFLRDFAASSGLTLRRGQTLIDDLSLKGSAAGVGALKRCLEDLKQERAAAERERSRLSHIPGDPFAPAPSEREAIGLAPVVPSVDEFPSAALRSAATGQVHYRLIIGSDDKMKECRITEGSGVSALDQESCSLLARKKPWIGRGAVGGEDRHFTGVVDWRR